MRFEPEDRYPDYNTRPEIFFKKSNSKNQLISLFKRFSTPLVVIVMFLVAILLAYSLATFGSKIGLLFVAVMVGIPIVFAVVIYPRFGIIILMIFAYFIMFMLRLIQGFPLGTIMDALQYLLIFGFFLKQKYNTNWEILKSPISIIILLWFLYNIFQVANPTTEARMAWLYTVRTVGIITLMYFIFTYYIRSVEYIRILFKVWIGLAIFAAIYGNKQEYFGFFAFEEAGLEDPLVQALLFINGKWRKFSIFSDPVAYSYNMVIAAVFCIAMLQGAISMRSKIIYGGLAAFFSFSMLHSGTRGAYVLIPAAIILYVTMHINKKTLIFSSIGAVFFLMLINMPTGNITLYRFQSAFKPSDDASFNVRAQNQKMIQPYILSHPLGGGLGATGVWGVRFAPNSFLANFPPDSGYVRVAVELGWVGLLLFCFMMFIILKEGVIGYFNIRDPELKTYCLAMTLVIFAINIGNYPQEAMVQFPTNIYFYLFVAIISACIRIDKEEVREKPKSVLQILMS